MPKQVASTWSVTELPQLPTSSLFGRHRGTRTASESQKQRDMFTLWCGFDSCTLIQSHEPRWWRSCVVLASGGARKRCCATAVIHSTTSCTRITHEQSLDT